MRPVVFWCRMFPTVSSLDYSFVLVQHFPFNSSLSQVLCSSFDSKETAWSSNARTTTGLIAIFWLITSLASNYSALPIWWYPWRELRCVSHLNILIRQLIINPLIPSNTQFSSPTTLLTPCYVPSVIRSDAKWFR